jgi:hypothetical protein
VEYSEARLRCVVVPGAHYCLLVAVMVVVDCCFFALQDVNFFVVVLVAQPWNRYRDVSVNFAQFVALVDLARLVAGPSAGCVELELFAVHRIVASSVVDVAGREWRWVAGNAAVELEWHWVADTVVGFVVARCNVADFEAARCTVVDFVAVRYNVADFEAARCNAVDLGAVPDIAAVNVEVRGIAEQHLDCNFAEFHLGDNFVEFDSDPVMIRKFR